MTNKTLLKLAIGLTLIAAGTVLKNYALNELGSNLLIK